MTPFAQMTATNDPAELLARIIITGLKSHQLADAAEGLAGLLKEGTRVIQRILNSIPWWYFHRDGGHAERWLCRRRS